MKAIFLYRPNAEFARQVEEYAHDFEKERNKEIELKSLDTVEGADMAQLYDIMEFPSLLVIRDDGQLSKVWQGNQLPLKDEVVGFLEQ